MNKQTGFRARSNNIFTKSIFIISTFIWTTTLMTFFGGIGFLVGLAIALITFWASRWDWSYFGISAPNWKASFLKAFIYTAFIILFIDVLLAPIVEHYTGMPQDLSGFDYLKGDFLKLLLFMLFMWVIAGFGEEFFYRGYLMKRLAALLGNSDNAWLVAILLSSIPFGLVHFYQGISGMITTGAVGLILGFAFYQNKKNLIVCMLTHGIYDMFGLTMIYFGKETVISDWAQQFLFSTIY
jgi:membrane protease YdiL (CAAX protease family)